MAYRETAMRHGDRWLVRKRIGIKQELRKGKGDAAELEAKLAILQNVMGQRQALSARARKTIEGLEEKQVQLEGKKKRIGGQIAESELMRRKMGVEGQLGELKEKIVEVEETATRLAWIGKNGLAPEKHVRDFWERQLG